VIVDEPVDLAASGPGGNRRRHRRARIVPTDEGHGVTTLELFFDLVFVFAITQITTFMAAAVLVLSAPLATAALPALAALAVLAGLLVALVAFEVIRYADARAAVRAEEAHH
jgi:low temperature requirement protein LtrA